MAPAFQEPQVHRQQSQARARRPHAHALGRAAGAACGGSGLAPRRPFGNQAIARLARMKIVNPELGVDVDTKWGFRVAIAKLAAGGKLAGLQHIARTLHAIELRTADEQQGLEIVTQAVADYRPPGPHPAAVPIAGQQPFDRFPAGLPADITRYIAGFIGESEPTPGGPVAQDPRSLLSFAAASKHLRQVIAQGAYDLGLPQARAVRELADTPHHGLTGFEQDEAEPWRLPRTTRYTVDPESVALFNQRWSGNAFCGVANVDTGVITLYPLASEEEELQRSPSDAPAMPGVKPEYQTTAWRGRGTFRGAPVKTIVHSGDERAPQEDPGLVSHELLATQILRGSDTDYVGFTLHAERHGRRNIEFVWSSRSLNAPKFHAPGTDEGGGHPTAQVAAWIVAACARDLKGSWNALNPRPPA
jgi:hypothetical protein